MDGQLRHLLGGRKTAFIADALADLLALIRPLLVSIARALAEEPDNARTLIASEVLRLAAEADKGQPARVLRRVAGSLAQFLDHRLDRAIEEAQDRHVGTMIDVIRAIALEVERGHGPALRTVRMEDWPGRSPRIVARWITPSTIPAHAPLLHLDGTADPDLVPA